MSWDMGDYQTLGEISDTLKEIARVLKVIAKNLEKEKED